MKPENRGDKRHGPVEPDRFPGIIRVMNGKRVELSAKGDLTLGPEVVAFRDREGLGEELATAIELVGKHFKLLADLVVVLEQDPELDREYLVIEATTRGRTMEVVAAHGSYAREWASRVAWPKSEKIRLNYDIC